MGRSCSERIPRLGGIYLDMAPYEADFEEADISPSSGYPSRPVSGCSRPIPYVPWVCMRCTAHFAADIWLAFRHLSLCLSPWLGGLHPFRTRFSRRSHLALILLLLLSTPTESQARHPLSHPLTSRPTEAVFFDQYEPGKGRTPPHGTTFGFVAAAGRCKVLSVRGTKGGVPSHSCAGVFFDDGAIDLPPLLSPHPSSSSVSRQLKLVHSHLTLISLTLFFAISTKQTRNKHPAKPTYPMTMDATTGLVIGFDGRHPFSKVELTDRASVQELLRTLLDPLEPFFSPEKARVRCPGATAVRFDLAASDVEGLCRPLWGLACLLAGGGDYRGTQWWIDGIRAGTDPNSPEYWGYPRDNDQRMVEMCPLGGFPSRLTRCGAMS
jgi:hypothetical protein